MKLFKKGDLSLRYIVLAALGLMVLIVIVLIFLKGSDFFVVKLKGIWTSITGMKPDFGKTTIK